MDIDITNDIAQPTMPKGFHLCNLDNSEQPADSWAVVQNAAFTENLLYTPISHAEWMKRIRARDFDPQLALTAVDSGGHVVAALLASCGDSQDLPGVGYIERVGTLPTYRSRGLATSLILSALRLLKERGATRAFLQVDGCDETNAQRLYARIGFRITFEYDVWEQVLRPAPEIACFR
jgi:ribosomal protein S18 acetylase RimI-like enzyme